MKPRGYWTPFKQAVEEMIPNDLLIWKMPAEDVQTANSRLDDVRDSERKIVSNFCDGKLFIVRVR